MAEPKPETRKHRLERERKLACEIWFCHWSRAERIAAWQQATRLKQSNFYARIAEAKATKLFSEAEKKWMLQMYEEVTSQCPIDGDPFDALDSDPAEATPSIAKKMPALLSSKDENWATPWDLFNEWNERFHFDVDVCADATNSKCEKYFDVAADGLKQRWAPLTCWMNPPYGKSIGHWMAKAYTESLYGATVVCLVNYRPTTQWYKTWATKGEIHLLEKRIKFIHPQTREAQTASPHHSVIVVFRPVGADDKA